jgi:predicted MFS family arabinose efflux permease
VVAVLALGSCASLAAVRAIPDTDDAGVHGDGPGQRALAAARTSPFLVPLLGGLITGIGMTNIQLVVPLVVQDEAGAAGGAFGVLLAFIGLGGVVGAGLAASLRSGPTNRLLVFVTFGFVVVCMAFAATPTGPWMAGALFLAGMTMQLYGTMGISALQLRAPRHLQSRMMSFYVIAFFIWAPFGSPVFGWLAHLVGPRQALALVAAACLPVVAWMVLLSRHPRRLDAVDPVTGGS